MKYLDTNVIIRYLVKDDAGAAAASKTFFQRVADGEEEIFTSETVIGEVVYVLNSPRGPYRLDREQLRARLVPILALPGLKLLEKRAHLRALEVFATMPFLDFADAMAVAYMEARGVREIVSYDRDFDRLAGMVRAEPA